MKNISMKSTQLIEDSYTNYHHSVYLYIYYRIAHKEEAEDLAQDVYVRLMDYDRMPTMPTLRRWYRKPISSTTSRLRKF